MADKERMQHYSIFAAAFSYPDDKFFAFFPEETSGGAALRGEYDRLFRAGNVWLEGAEHMVKNEFQRANLLSDIMGFYLAFGVEPDKQRPDSLTCELEFMRYLIFKRDHTSNEPVSDDAEEKAAICRDAEQKFFREHLAPAARKIADNIILKSKHPFYGKAAEELLGFLECETLRFA